MKNAPDGLRWVQPKWNRRHYELRDGERVLVRVEHRGSWRPAVYILLDGEELELRQRSAWRSTLLIMRGKQQVAVFEQSGPNRNQVRFVSGRQFRWKRNGFWSLNYDFVAPDNEVVASFKRVARLFRSEGVVTLSPSSYKYPEMRILLALGWYLLLASGQAAAAAATAG
jgi:hypothetical protein